jgi:hypothetical protein
MEQKLMLGNDTLVYHKSKMTSQKYVKIGKCKGKVVPVLFLTEHHAMKTHWGSGGIAPSII